MITTNPWQWQWHNSAFSDVSGIGTVMLMPVVAVLNVMSHHSNVTLIFLVFIFVIQKTDE
jgi:hypothetical protein